MPECICVHKKNILAFRVPVPDEKSVADHYMVLNLGVKGEEASGGATSYCLGFYDRILKGHEQSRMDRPALFNSVKLPEKAKGWIDCNGTIYHGNIPVRLIPEYRKRD